MTDASSVGFVAIGRNEGGRFKACLEALLSVGERVVYVDSGSHDDSVEFAQGKGANVVELTTDIPFTAARARNAGFDALIAKWPDTERVMFIDGDCILCDGFVASANRHLEKNQDTAIVTGRCRERFPEATIYNRLCEIEWNGPIGEISACGGIFLVRTKNFKSVGGFNPTIIAAEDDDFCVRVREDGSRILRIDADMCLHDADIHHFRQWWQRMVRAGHAFAQLGEIHPGYFKAQRRRAWGWGFFLPVLSLLLVPMTWGLSLLLLFLYPLSLFRTRSGLIAAGIAAQHATLAALFMTLSKFPNLKGIIDYRVKKLKRRNIGIVEYK
ncbi:glycosyltransferase [Hyphococcus lacteus]|uniref:Glycosyltransferase n=1 Tax=Hyphococcus lacteus TaxID=3143536 RepID=A0ABV3Z3N3_9PROT